LTIQTAGPKARLFSCLLIFLLTSTVESDILTISKGTTVPIAGSEGPGQKKLVDNMLRISYIETIKYGRKLPPLFENLVPKPRGNSMMAKYETEHQASRGPRLKKTSVATRAEIRGVS
jgi:hypothetical protein